MTADTPTPMEPDWTPERRARLEALAEAATAQSEAAMDLRIRLARLSGFAADLNAALAEIAHLQAYEVELRKIAESVGEEDDPFAAWESIDRLQVEVKRKDAALEPALAAIDDADKACPIRTPEGARAWRMRHGPFNASEACPKCGATASGSCGPNVRALVGLETAVRAAASARGEGSGR